MVTGKNLCDRIKELLHRNWQMLEKTYQNIFLFITPGGRNYSLAYSSLMPRITRKDWYSDPSIGSSLFLECWSADRIRNSLLESLFVSTLEFAFRRFSQRQVLYFLQQMHLQGRRKLRRGGMKMLIILRCYPCGLFWSRYCCSGLMSRPINP